MALPSGRLDRAAARAHPKSMPMTLETSDGLLAEVREIARQKSSSLDAVLEEAPRPGLTPLVLARKAVRLVTRRVGVAESRQTSSLNQLYDEIEAAEGAMRGLHQ